MDDLFFESDQSRLLSANEITAIMKNTIEERLLQTKKKLIKSEHKQNSLLIKNVRFNTEALYDSIKVTTGSSSERIENIFNTTTIKYSANQMQNKILPRSQSVASKRVVKFTYNKADPEVIRRNTKSASELNPSKKLEDDSFEIYVFDDRKLYNKYLDLCQERDRVPRSLPQRIDILKRKDPVFAKRYKQFLSSKICNRAPKFDPKDNLLPMKLPKIAIKREKENIIKLVKNIPFRKPEGFKFELEQINQRVKTFISNFDNELYV